MPRHILVASMPKSSSTFVSNAIAEVTGFKKVALVPDYERREQELCELRLFEMSKLDYVASLHIRYSRWTDKLCQDHGITQIVTIRSLFDVVISARDHYRQEDLRGAATYLDQAHVDLCNADLEKMIATFTIPWYINFYLGWRKAPHAKIIRYEDVAADPEETIYDVVRFAGLSVSREDVAAGLKRTVEKGSNRLNVGVAGRGRELSPDTVAQILGMLAMYPEIANDPYVVAMKDQAAEILSAHGQQAPVLRQAFVQPSSPPKAAPATTFHFAQFLKNLKRLGRRKNRLLGLALILAGTAYFALLADLIPDGTLLGRLDDLLIPGLCAFTAGRFFTKERITRVPVPFLN